MENYQDYIVAFKDAMKIAIDNANEENKEILEEIEPLTESEWAEAKESGLFNTELDEEAVKNLYEEINRLYPEEDEE
jgi:fructose-1,6-bisphosphatase/inositol monophosphatase family enzyme